MKISVIFFSVVLAGFFLSCNKNNFNYAKDTVGSSKVIYFPTVKIKGDRLIILSQNAAFTEPGVDAILNGATTPTTISGTVDPSTPGVYDLLYTAVNAQGYSASDFRTVVIIGNDVAANDFSGVYLREATGVTSTWVKNADGVYSVENPGGSSGVGLNVIAVNYTGTKIAIPHQISPDLGEVSSANETYTLTPPPPTYTWVLLAGGYGTGPRTFVKQ